MNLSSYTDEELIEELKLRGIKLEVRYPQDTPSVYIGGVRFDVII